MSIIAASKLGEKVEITSATQVAVNYLRDLIIMGELGPGQKINETLFAAEIGLSRPPLREALRLLEAERLVVSVPRKATYVRDVSLKDHEEISQSRGMIECYAVDLLRLKNVNDFSSVEATLSEASTVRIQRGMEPREILNCLKIFSEFHVKLVALAGNEQIIQFYRSILSSVWRYQFMYFSRSATQFFFEAHGLILKNIKHRKYEEAKIVLLEHMTYDFEKFVREKGVNVPL